MVICKPAIRRTARVGDWILGTGSKAAKMDRRTTRDLSCRVVYAMLVTEKVTMQQYDGLTKSRLPEKIPVWEHVDRRRRVGDSLYDFSASPVVQRPGVHRAENQETDLSGGFALLSNDFYYFGANAIALPGDLAPVAQNQQGHRVKLNEPYVERFITWIRGAAPGVQGEPLLDLFADDTAAAWCARCRADEDDDEDETVELGC